MQHVTVHTIVCPTCHADADPREMHCPRCSMPLDASPPQASVAAVRRSLRESVVDNPWGVLGLLFLAAGVLGLPVLWRSQAFSLGAKLVLSVVVTVYSLAMVGILIWILWKTALLVAPLLATLPA
jgi:hypothetical protein